MRCNSKISGKEGQIDAAAYVSVSRVIIEIHPAVARTSHADGTADGGWIAADHNASPDPGGMHCILELGGNRMIATALRKLAPQARRSDGGNVVSLRRRTTPPAGGLPRLRTIFISGRSIWARAAAGQALAAFLRRHACETLYLVGDIVDGWRLKRSWYCVPPYRSHQEILRKAQNGTRVIFIPGNHDEARAAYAGLNLAGVDVASRVSTHRRRPRLPW